MTGITAPIYRNRTRIHKCDRRHKHSEHFDFHHESGNATIGSAPLITNSSTTVIETHESSAESAEPGSNSLQKKERRTKPSYLRKRILQKEKRRQRRKKARKKRRKRKRLRQKQLRKVNRKRYFDQLNLVKDNVNLTVTAKS